MYNGTTSICLARVLAHICRKHRCQAHLLGNCRGLIVFLRKYSLDVKVFCYQCIAFILPSFQTKILFENRDLPKHGSKITDKSLYYILERSYLMKGYFFVMLISI